MTLPNQPKWDLRFLRMAEEVSTWSKDPRTKVGALIVSPDRRQFSTGYNGFPRKIADTLERLTDREIKNKIVVHAEMNAIDNCKFDVQGCSLYTTLFPCNRCCVSIINNNIKRIITFNDFRKEMNHDLSYELFEEAGVEVILFSSEYKVDHGAFCETVVTCQSFSEKI